MKNNVCAGEVTVAEQNSKQSRKVLTGLAALVTTSRNRWKFLKEG